MELAYGKSGHQDCEERKTMLVMLVVAKGSKSKAIVNYT
jgi:hypothetical protein